MNTKPNNPKKRKESKNSARNKRKRAANANKENGRDEIEYALERINALQQELAMEGDDSDSGSEGEEIVDPDDPTHRTKVDAKTLGFIACAHETMKYLSDQGIPKDNPMMVTLRNRLLEGIYKI